MAEIRHMRIEGARELDDVLARLPDELARHVVEQALRKAANVVRDAYKANVPVSSSSPADRRARSSSGKDYGPLRDNIRTSKIKAPPGSAHMAVHNGRAFWGMFLEFGTSRQPARPYFRQAFDGNADRALAVFGEELGKGLDKVARELAGRFGRIRKSTRRRL